MNSDNPSSSDICSGINNSNGILFPIGNDSIIQYNAEISKNILTDNIPYNPNFIYTYDFNAYNTGSNQSDTQEQDILLNNNGLCELYYPYSLSTHAFHISDINSLPRDNFSIFHDHDNTHLLHIYTYISELENRIKFLESLMNKQISIINSIMYTEYASID